jgi:hypothetical protein
MTSTELRNAVRAQPFKPFIIHMGGGRNLLVDHPEIAAIDPNGRTAIIFKRDGGWEVVDILMIQSLEFSPRRDNRGGNGGRKKAG